MKHYAKAEGSYSSFLSLPDYKISTVLKKGRKKYLHTMSVYIDDFVNLDDGKMVTGTILDKFGCSQFQGEISDKYFVISVKYDQDAIENGAPKDRVWYSAKKTDDSYIGKCNIEGSDEINSFGVRKYNPLRARKISLKPYSRRSKVPA